MATATQHYGLHQWEAKDHFLRTEFNEDFGKIDAGIHAAKSTADQAMDALMPVSYNVYNLILQNYYEGKQTGYRRALLFDGFLNDAGIESITGGGGYDRANRRLSTSLSPYTGNINLAASVATTGSTGIIGYQPFFCTQGSNLTGVTLKLQAEVYQEPLTCALRLAVVGWSTVSNRPDGRVLATSQAVVTSNIKNSPITVYLPISCPLDAANYALRVELVSTTGQIILYGGYLSDQPVFLSADMSPGVRTLAYQLNLSPASGSPTLYTRPVSAGVAFGRAVGYVCHSAGNIALTMTERNGAHPMALAESRYVTAPDGVSCMEKQFSLDLGMSALRDPIKFELGFQTGYVYSYGVMLF